MSKILTLALVKQQIKNANPSIELISKKYKGKQHLHNFRCLQCSHRWKKKPNDVTVSGSGCPKCCKYHSKVTLPSIKRHLKKVSPKIQVISSVYRTYHKLSVMCRVCKHEWKAVWDSLKSSHGCPACWKARKPFADSVWASRAPAGITVRIRDKIAHCQCDKCAHQWTAPRGRIVECDNCPKILKLKNLSKKLSSTTEIVSDAYSAWMEFRCKKCKRTWFSTPYQGRCRQCSSHLVLVKESEVRDIIECLTGWKFPKVSPKNSPVEMELDGYNAEHYIAFERQGEWHYRPHWSYYNKEKILGEVALKKQKLRDHKKNMRCLRAGIHLIRVPYFKKDVESFIKSKLELP